MLLLPRLWKITKDAGNEWLNDKATKLAASLAYYTAFSLAPLLILTVAVLSFVYGQEAAQGQVASQMQRLIGGQAARATQEMVKHASQQGGGVLATVVSIVIILFSASGVFGELQDSMAMVFGIIFLLLVSLVISTLVSAMSTHMTGSVHIIARAIDVIVSIGVIAVLFMMLFKFLPDVKVRWRDVFLAGILTSVLFTIGKYLLGLYLGRSSTTSTYGAAGSFAALLLWVYYSAQILFFGAEFAKAFAKSRGRLPMPTANAVPMSPERKDQLGIAPDRKRQAAQAHFVEPRPMPFASALCPAPRSPGAGKRLLTAGAALLTGYFLANRNSLLRLVSRRLIARNLDHRPDLQQRISAAELRLNRVDDFQEQEREAEVNERIDLIEDRINRVAKRAAAD